MGSIVQQHPLSQRPTYNDDQLSTYVALINPDPSYSLAKLRSEIQENPLAALSTLQLRQIAAVHWGNVALHYSHHRTLALDPDSLFHKIVERKFGGYCMENNAFFSTILRSLGYQIYVSGARISNALMGHADPDGFAGWQHEVILVIIDGQKYLVDVGLGGGCPVHPIPLDKSTSQSYDTTPGSSVRVVRRNIASHTTDQQVWVLELSNTTTNTWSAAYCFTEVEWLPQDFEIINFNTSQSPRSWFTYRVILVRLVIDEETRTKALGSIMLMDHKFERRLGDGKKELLLEAKTEEERVQGLRQWFGIILRPEEERGIRALASEIRGAPPGS
ncbi:hypothetical protein PV10_02535 [Exophiala mesophila]|uniref:Uncharacterized protein n=1 Tax=Exophiala mesophila TaxID=212818 RepID=A0A0D2A6Z5_EXOME|nr:uncharacterized protein PV10_02535 [Exophiala mesophila]KIV94803.1 hypothetical protein PV10_02535 [Exophiala mesophila]